MRAATARNGKNTVLNNKSAWGAMSEPLTAVAQDHFLEDLLGMIQRGSLARIPGSILKGKIVLKIQQYSAEFPIVQEGVSRIFLDLCNLMLEGGIGRMAPDAFKVYLVLLALSFVSEEPPSEGTIRDLTGIEDQSRLSDALLQLEKDGHITSSQRPQISNTESRSRKDSELFELPFGAQSHQAPVRSVHYWNSGYGSQTR